MLQTISSTALIIAREGFESILLTVMITAALPNAQRASYYLNLVLTWIVTLALGWMVVDWLTTYVEYMENILKVVAGLVLIYVYVNSKEIFSHAKEHVDQLDTTSWITTQLTIFLIVVREAMESTVFLRSNAQADLTSTLYGVALGVAAMAVLFYASIKLGDRVTNKLVFRYLGPTLAIFGAYMIYLGSEELLEIFGIL